MNVPRLRFKEFSGAWEVKKLGEITIKVGSGSTPRGGEKVYQSYGIPFIRSQNVNSDRLILNDITYIPEKVNYQMRGSIVKSDDVLLNITGASIGRSCVVPSDFKVGNVNQHVCIIRLKKEYSPRFFQPYLSSANGQKLISRTQVGSGREGLNFQFIRSFKIFAPLIPEQTKIANFLTAVDEKIAQHTQKADLLARYKKGVMQQLFSQQLRFKDDDGQEFPEWDYIELEKIAFKITLKNKDFIISHVLTNSATQGIVNQADYFDRDIANQNNLGGYYVAEIDDFVYNPRISSNALVGPIKRNNLIRGVMSPLYTVFRFKEGILPFFEQYFATTHWHDYMKSVSNSAARHDRMNITNESFFGLPVLYPSLAEQTKIANFLTSLDDKISHNKTQLNALKQYKQGLLQQLFV